MLEKKRGINRKKRIGKGYQSARYASKAMGIMREDSRGTLVEFMLPSDRH